MATAEEGVAEQVEVSVASGGSVLVYDGSYGLTQSGELIQTHDSSSTDTYQPQVEIEISEDGQEYIIAGRSQNLTSDFTAEVVAIADDALPAEEIPQYDIANNTFRGRIAQGQEIIVQRQNDEYIVSSSKSFVAKDRATDGLGPQWRNKDLQVDKTQGKITTPDSGDITFSREGEGVTISDFVSSMDMFGVRYSDKKIAIWNNDGTIQYNETTKSYKALVSTNFAIAGLNQDRTIEVWTNDTSYNFPSSYGNTNFIVLQGFENFFLATKCESDLSLSNATDALKTWIDGGNSLDESHLETARTITGNNDLTTTDTATEAIREWVDENSITSQEQLRFVIDLTCTNANIMWPQPDNTVARVVQKQQQQVAFVSSDGSLGMNDQKYTMVKDLVVFPDDDGKLAILNIDGSVTQTLTTDPEFVSAIAYGVDRILQDSDGGLIAMKKDGTAIRWCNQSESQDDIEAFVPLVGTNSCHLLKNDKIHHLRIKHVDFVTFDREHFWEYKKDRSRYEHRQFVLGYDAVIGDYPFMERIYPGNFIHINNFGNFDGFYYRFSYDEYRNGRYRIKKTSDGKLRIITKNFVYTSTQQASYYADKYQKINFITNDNHVWRDVEISVTRQIHPEDTRPTWDEPITVQNVLTPNFVENVPEYRLPWNPGSIFHRGLVPFEEIIMLDTNFAEIGRITWDGAKFDESTWTSSRFTDISSAESIEVGEVLSRTIRKRIGLGRTIGTGKVRPYHTANFVRKSLFPRSFPIENVPETVSSSESSSTTRQYNVTIKVSSLTQSGRSENVADAVTGNYTFQPEGVAGASSYKAQRSDLYHMYPSKLKKMVIGVPITVHGGYILESEEILSPADFERKMRSFIPFDLTFTGYLNDPYHLLLTNWCEAKLKVVSSQESGTVTGERNNYKFKITQVKSSEGVEIPLPVIENKLKIHVIKRDLGGSRPSQTVTTSDFLAERTPNQNQTLWYFDSTFLFDSLHVGSTPEREFFNHSTTEEYDVWVRRTADSEIRFRSPEVRDKITLRFTQVSMESLRRESDQNPTNSVEVFSFYDRHPDLHVIVRNDLDESCFSKFVKGTSTEQTLSMTALTEFKDGFIGYDKDGFQTDQRLYTDKAASIVYGESTQVSSLTEFIPEQDQETNVYSVYQQHPILQGNSGLPTTFDGSTIPDNLQTSLLIIEGGSSRGIYPYDHTTITSEGSFDQLNIPESINLTQGSGEVYVEDGVRYTWYTNIGFNIVKNPLYVPESNLPTLEITCSHNQRLFIVSGFPQGFYYLNKLWESSTTGEMSTFTHHGVVGFEELKDTTFRRYLTDNTAPDSTVKPFCGEAVPQNTLTFTDQSQGGGS